MTRAAFACVILVLAATAGVAARGEDTSPPKVIVAAPVEQTVTRYFEAAGAAAAVNSVDLVARVQGFVQEITYVDGAFVKKGTPLFTIEPEPYSLKLEAAKLSVARARAALTLAETEFKRQAELMAKQSTSGSAYDRALAQLDDARSDLQSAQADEKAAEINLGYTKVNAPFDGIVTDRQVSLGQLVGADNQHPTVLAIIVQLDPIYVTFTVSELEVLQIRAYLARRGQDPRASLVGLPVDVGLLSETDNPHKGTLDYTAPFLNPTTKTLAARASLANGDRALLPGYSVRVRIPQWEEQALLVPDVALGSDQNGRYVLVINKDSVVEQRRVEQGQLIGNLRVIEKGLRKEDRVIVGGMHAIPGQKVDAELRSAPAAN
ncbi:MAG TPA: efflux RND transporter periplasmic adaptor subunit [Burkholderiaceae bacterium]|nr:efflux RND transporter periplasmic adaptor subunit [Burkholderiaceae bacterium]